MQSTAQCQSLRATRAQPMRRARTAVRVCAQQKSESNPLAVVAGVVAASLLSASAVDAKVILEQPKLKQAFVQETTEEAPVEKKKLSLNFAPPSAKSAEEKAESKSEGPKFEAPTLSEGGVDPRSVALPGAVLALLGGGFALSKVDPAFADKMTSKWLYKDSIDLGAGYEEALKAGNAAAGAVGKGTRAIKSKSKSFFSQSKK